MPIPAASFFVVVALLVLLAPGFMFWGGFSLFGRHSSEVAPRSTLGLLAMASILSLLIHLACFPILSTALAGDSSGFGSISMRFDTLKELNQFISAVSHYHWPLIVYVIGTTFIGLCLGMLTGYGIAHRWWGIKHLARHGWAYDQLRKGDITFAHVLTSCGPDATPIIYEGELSSFGLGEDGSGRIVYLCLRQVKKGVLVIDERGTRTDGRRRMEPVPQSETMFIIHGDQIRNVLFSRVRSLKKNAVNQLIEPSREEWRALYEIAAQRVLSESNTPGNQKD